MSVDVVPYNRFVWQCQPKDVVSKVRVPLFPDDILVNNCAPNISSSPKSTLDLLGFGVLEEVSSNNRTHDHTLLWSEKTENGVWFAKRWESEVIG